MLCNNELVKQLLKLDAKSLAKIYVDFSNALYEEEYPSRSFTGRMALFFLTPPWLRGPVVFLHGYNNNISIPFANIELPRKNYLREKGKKAIGCAMLTTWLSRETSGVGHLRKLLEKHKWLYHNR